MQHQLFGGLSQENRSPYGFNGLEQTLHGGLHLSAFK